jgi:hypothetical protein
LPVLDSGTALKFSAATSTNADPGGATPYTWTHSLQHLFLHTPRRRLQVFSLLTSHFLHPDVTFSFQ